jgi:uncharacterized membrane protein YhhN
MNGPLVALTVGASLSATLAIRANYLGPCWLVYLCKPLATTLIPLVALIAPAPTAPPYQIAIGLGLGFSLLGDVWLMWPSDRFVAGLVSFLLAHLCYGVAFVTRGWETLSPVWLIPYALYGVGILQVLSPRLGRLRLAVVVYMGVILTMAWLATGAQALAAVGAALFVVSDSVLAYEKFVRAWRPARWVVLSTYWAAQWLIAVSVWG